MVEQRHKPRPSLKSVDRFATDDKRWQTAAAEAAAGTQLQPEGVSSCSWSPGRMAVLKRLPAYEARVHRTPVLGEARVGDPRP